MKNITTILIANRGEIASRVIRTCQKMGIKSVAVFSEADRQMPFVEQADMAVFIGESSPAASYLDQDKIIATAKKVKADAIHPGYGFLSENAGFAERCAQEGIIFIGPNPAAIDAMGSKSKAKSLMKKHRVPVVPGYQGEDQSAARLKKEAIAMGFPVLLKATAGGGGKGMRIVHEAAGVEKAIEAAKRESLSAFGNDELIVEKYIASGRHIEFQIFGDQHGNAIHILERECSIQRRYQKVIEESPSPVMSTELREKMGTAAVNAAKALNYDNAGTVEFIYDDQSGDFYFLEVNTRLQVEHPVTEEITGLDLVQMQVESAQGLPLAIEQKDVKGQGYAIEARLYAEDASNDFLPVTGTIQRFEYPAIDGLRVESAIKSGSEISVFYDPMIAKIIVHDATRAGAMRKMQYVLKNLICQGMTTNQDFLLHLVQNADFQQGKYNTHFIKNHIDLNTIAKKEETDVVLAGIAATLHGWQKRQQKRTLLRSIPSGWRNNFYAPQSETFTVDKVDLKIEYRKLEGNEFTFYKGETTHYVKLIECDNQTVRSEIDGIQYGFNIAQNGKAYFVHNEHIGNITLVHQDRFPAKEAEKVVGGYETPMPSQIIKILVEKGQAVKAGEGLVVLSSMKMENTIEAVEDGVVEEIYAEEGGNVAAGFLLLKLGAN
ncbi:MAG: biotin carboxylase N-terminal domain-containing protein [Bacteroidota bacterium]